MTCIWIGGGDYPAGGREFNLMNDIAGANVVFSSEMPLWQVTMSLYKEFAVSLAELQVRVRPCGEIGRYLFDELTELNPLLADNPVWPHGELWGLGDEGCVAALMQEVERTSCYEEISAPRVLEDMTYLHGQNNRKIRVYRHLDVRTDLEDLFAKLQINFCGKDQPL